MKDCFGVEYEVARMPGNDLCGYSALAYALTGDKRQYTLVIKDLRQSACFHSTDGVRSFQS